MPTKSWPTGAEMLANYEKWIQENPRQLYHAELFSRITKVTLLLIEAKDKDDARRQAWREINRRGYGFVARIWTADEYNKKHGGPWPLNQKKDVFICQAMKTDVTIQECQSCQKQKLVKNCMQGKLAEILAL